MLPLAVEWNDSLSLGEGIVGAGTLALAWFTYRLARATYALDERNAARERKRRERQVRGVARLVDAELAVTAESLADAQAPARWSVLFLTPHGAWDRDGALIAETLPQDEAEALIDFMSHLTAWETMASRSSREVRFGIVPLGSAQQEELADLIARLNGARPYLQKLAYPDARDLERDPDSYLAWQRERRRKWLGKWVPERLRGRRPFSRSLG